MDNTELGWIPNKYQDLFYRIPEDRPWYIEIKDPDGNRWLSKFTIKCLLIGNYCATYGLDYSISNLHALGKLGVDEIPSKDGWLVLDTTEIDLYMTVKHEIIIKYTDILISNSFGESDVIKDFYMRIISSLTSGTSISCWRENVQYEHIKNKYMHSHVPAFGYMLADRVDTFCTGSYRNSVNTGLRGLDAAVLEATTYMQRVMSNKPLGIDNAEHIDIAAEMLEYKIISFTGCLNSIIRTESIEGVPHKMMRYNYLTCKFSDGSIPDSIDNVADEDDYYDDDFDVFDEPSLSSSVVKIFDDFADTVTSNMDDERIKFRVDNNTVKIIPSKGLVSFAKDHGFFNDCFANQHNVGGSYYIPTNATPTMSEEDRKDIDNQAKWVKSPFLWHGTLLTLKPISLPNSYTINEDATRLHSHYTKAFNERIARNFKDRIKRYSRNPS